MKTEVFLQPHEILRAAYLEVEGVTEEFIDKANIVNREIHKATIKAMERLAEQQCDIVHDLFMKSTIQLKPLEDLWRKENPHPEGKFVIPDATEFYKWIRLKILPE